MSWSAVAGVVEDRLKRERDQVGGVDPRIGRPHGSAKRPAPLRSWASEAVGRCSLGQLGWALVSANGGPSIRVCDAAKTWNRLAVPPNGKG